jgi:hypothetical protein
MTQAVSILVPNYRTKKLTMLCLRLLRKYTDLKNARIIVIDNDSNDESLTYLRSLSWIQLIERPAIPGETGVAAHAKALDLGLQYVDTPYVLSIHTDTLVKHAGWLPYLLSHIEGKANVAGVGSWKLEFKTVYQRVLKSMERSAQHLYYRVLNQENHMLEGIGKNYYYLRSHCALYRTSLLQQYKLHFADGDMVAGKYLHQFLSDAGYQLLFLSSEELSRYVEHVNHATTVLNPELSSRKKSVEKGLKRIEKSLERLGAEAIFRAHELDRG